ncbi:MAG: ABC transporter permease [Oscillospiraceae bacterium]|nr:ABC transporter permease [Oscillospiraceae bacterium]
MRMLTFAKRCLKEILRDPLNLMFGLGFPVVLLLLLSAIGANAPVNLFEIKHLTPGITVFGLSFITLFSATLISKDRESSLIQRLYTTPLRPRDFILGYLLPLLPIALVQAAACYLIAFLLGFPATVNVLYALLALLPACVFYVSLGLLCGSVLSVKQVGGICGALLTNLSAWLSGVWFDISLVGETFGKIAKLLPFIHAVELERAVISGDFAAALPHLLPVTLYAIITTAAAILLFLRQMKRQ